MSLGVAIFLPILLLAIAAQFRRPPPRHDWTAERHRQISRNAFKSRMGLR